MGKVKRSKASKIDLEKSAKHVALEDQMTVNYTAKPTGRNKQRSKEIDDEEACITSLQRILSPI